MIKTLFKAGGVVCLVSAVVIASKAYSDYMAVSRKIKNDRKSYRYSSRDVLLQAKINEVLSNFDRKNPTIIDANLVKASLYGSLEICWLAAESNVSGCQVKTKSGKTIQFEFPQSVNESSSESLFFRHEFFLDGNELNGGVDEVLGVSLTGNNRESLTEFFPVRVVRLAPQDTEVKKQGNLGHSHQSDD